MGTINFVIWSRYYSKIFKFREYADFLIETESDVNLVVIKLQKLDFYEAKRYDLRGKKYLENSKKYYLCDSSFRYAINGTRNMDFGREYSPLLAIKDAYPKVIIARTHHEPYDYQGIQVLDLPRWLLKE